MAGRLQDETAVITGAHSGIEQAIAKAFAHEGADVVIAYHHAVRPWKLRRSGSM